MNTDNNTRATLGSRIGAILVAAGGSVGLGNIWRFPYVAGDNGGGAFLILYIGCIVLLGLPIMLAEMAIGRHSQLNVVGTYKSVSPAWRPLGYINLLISMLIMGFYFVVAGWTAEYFVSSVTGELAKLDSVEQYSAFFDTFRTNPWKPVLYSWIFIAVNHIIIALGVEKGIERSSKILMPVLFIILIVMSVNAVLMPGGAAGLEFLFKPDFSKINIDVFYQAMGQAFFSLSVGLGALITYASYFSRKTNIVKTAVSVTILDTLVAIIAGVMIFPVVFSVGIEPSSGPSLVFITLPAIFNTLPLSALWSSIFFLLLVIAAVTSTISLHEVFTLYIIEQWKIKRSVAAIITSAMAAVLATLASLSLGDWSGFTIMGYSFFDALDMFTSNILLPISGIGISLFAGWVLNKKILRDELTNFGELRFRPFSIFILLLRYLCPILAGVILLNSVGVL